MKQGQIAHIDHDPSNNDLVNLVFLCLDHHASYDSSSTQAKGITEGYVRTALDRLLEHFRLLQRGTMTVTLTLDRDFDSFTDDECAELLAELRHAASTKGPVRSLSIAPGSVKLELEMSGEDLANLLQAQLHNRLDKLNVTAIQYAAGSHCAIDFNDNFNIGLKVPTKTQVLQVVGDPDYSQPLLDRSPGIAKLFVKDSFPHERLAVLVLVSFRSEVPKVSCALVIPRESLAAWPIDRPRDLLVTFADRFCRPLPRFNDRKILFDESVPIVSGSPLDTLIRAMSGGPREAVFLHVEYRALGLGLDRIWIGTACKFDEEYPDALNASGMSINIAQWKRHHRTIRFV